jgi:hypothetical protein
LRLDVARFPVETVAERDALFSMPDPLAPPLAPSREQERQEAEEGLVLPPPRRAGLLAALEPVELPALEKGLHKLMEQLERLGRRPPGQEGAGLHPWLVAGVVAGAAAVVACAIARRQLGASRPTPLDQLFAR